LETATAKEVVEKARLAQAAARQLANADTAAKDRALLAMADALEEESEAILQANAKDLGEARSRGLAEALAGQALCRGLPQALAGQAFIERLTINDKTIDEMAQGLREVAALPDPAGKIIMGTRRYDGLELMKVRVPLGVVGIIYESRPNVTVDAAGLCIKAGNAVLLRGGSEAINSNIQLVKVISSAAREAGLPEGCIQLIETTDRAAAEQMMRLNGLIDVLIPRGGAELIQAVVQNATVPVIETGVGNCHVYVDAGADLAMAQEIVFNAKCQRPGVCNAMETLLVHQDVAEEFLPRAVSRLRQAGVEIRGCERTRQLVPDAKPATEEDWGAEYLALILAVKVVDSFDEAVAHINHYGTKHSEAIVTRDYDRARRFLRDVDAAAVYVNASTRLTDGGQFGLGAEIGISTQKLHARGPMGLEELTSYKWVVFGQGHLRK
jgi:glutamate-5-semialdehyde dehydrogenase